MPRLWRVARKIYRMRVGYVLYYVLNFSIYEVSVLKQLLRQVLFFWIMKCFYAGQYKFSWIKVQFLCAEKMIPVFWALFFVVSSSQECEKLWNLKQNVWKSLDGIMMQVFKKVCFCVLIWTRFWLKCTHRRSSKSKRVECLQAFLKKVPERPCAVFWAIMCNLMKRVFVLMLESRFN